MADALADWLKSHSKSRGLSALRLKCRRDYHAEGLWQRLGFVARGDVAGRGRDADQLTVWVHSLGPTDDLFSYADQADEDTKLNVVIDANVFFDLHGEDAALDKESRVLLEPWVDDAVKVHQRLTQEINYWDAYAVKLQAQEDAGKRRGGISASQARQRADVLSDRLKRRVAELEAEKKIVTRPPTVLGGALIVPAGLLAQLDTQGMVGEPPAPFGTSDREVERLAMEAVMAHERAMGHEPRDVSAGNLGYDIESRDPQTGHLRFIEVKGRVWSAETITVTANEIRTALNQPDRWFLAIVYVNEGQAQQPEYIRHPRTHAPASFAAARHTP